MTHISIRDLVHHDLASMTAEIAAVFGIKLYELTPAQRRAIDKVAYEFAGRAVNIVSDHR